MTTKNAVYFAAGFIVAVAASNWATEFQFEVGQIRFGNVGDGTFQQSDMHTDNYLRPIFVSFGITDKWAGSDRFGWRVAILDVGKIKVRDNSSVNDEQAHNHSGVPCTPPAEEGCTLRFNGEGRTFGISLGLTAEERLPRISPHLSIIGESGFFFFQHHFKAEGRFIDCPQTCRQISFNETSKLWDMPSPMAGITLRYREIYVALRHYWPSGNRAQSVTDQSFTQLAFGVAL